ncbi:polyprenyl synthetase family protein [Enterococcus mundtii]|uniref:Farnesyl-diphosphate synthase n=1 Tax=Enterococcus mundtii TaxID=53346 RepID=A0ABQ0VAW0_ENTMU|nr:farnesyl diphosphate synthase [Enterococcus mundtii]GEN16736.1 farnesyl-diphosphate synthase [Ligilactobacillus acidipiscis]AUB52060.1 geranyl transferase [Enterococcus mundtii]MZZ57802.1 polyprenyl synthetase family protein [Enterococcus mundtii]MZZ60777.1 polyprenyl synthetase family protein [Enterococcus mundtii]MZZ67762.1 polyprenyl synthetase family protein [Enterococcus mundtii]
MNLTDFSATHLPLVEEEMVSFITEYTSDERLKESMIYSIHAGGKRIRPLALLATVASFDAKIDTSAYQVAAALEMIHTYSLIHDDLPAMDNDDLRRGKPTNHKVYGEAIAILAGDGLLTGAFQLISMTHLANSPKLLLLQQLAVSAGTQGMVAGQAADIQGETKDLTLEELALIHERKTGRLIRYALLAGGILAEQPEEVLLQLQQIAAHLGLAFQIRDDLLDVTSTTEALGKTAGKDERADKNTYPRLLGIEQTRAALQREIHSANRIIAELEQEVCSFDGESLRQLVKRFDEK